MKLKHIEKFANVNKETIDNYIDEMYVNPLSIIANEEFRSNVKSDLNYRQRSINRVLNAGVPFDSDFNTLYDLFPRLFKVVNPYNGNEMKLKDGSGNSEQYTLNFVDEKTKDEISISLPHDAISVKPRKFQMWNSENPIPKDEQ